MVWAIYLFLIAGHDNRVIDIETVDMLRCQNVVNKRWL